MPKYKISFSGFAYVEADSENEACEDYEFNSIYEEKQIDNIEEVDEFTISLQRGADNG